MLIYIIAEPREGESFTEFYILGPNHKAEGYPRNILLGESNFLYIGIGNHEHEDSQYRLVLSIDPQADDVETSSMDNVTISRSRQPSMDISVKEDITTEVQCNFSILETGSYKLRFLLYKNGEEYRDLHIWVRVFQEQYLEHAENVNMEFYLAGPSGDPALLPDEIDTAETLLLSVGSRNLGNEERILNITFSLDDDAVWIPIDNGENEAFLQPGTGAYYRTSLNSTSSIGPMDIALHLPQGEWNLTVSFNYQGGSRSILHHITVGDGS
jgi:uncharacterized membrane protein